MESFSFKFSVISRTLVHVKYSEYQSKSSYSKIKIEKDHLMMKQNYVERACKIYMKRTSLSDIDIKNMWTL